MQNRYYQITATYFFLLLLVIIVFKYTPTNDGEAYLEYAKICIAEKQLYPCLKLIHAQPFIWNNGIINLTSLFLAISQSVYPLLFLMCVLKALTALLLAKITEIIFNQRIALCALALYVLYPNNWGQSTTIMSEIPALFLIMASLYLSLRYRNIRMTLLAGVILAIANWFRPVAIIFLGAIILYLFFFERTDAIKRSLASILGYIAMIIVIGTSCYLRTGYFIYQSDTLWFNMVSATYEKDTAPHYDSEMFPKGTPRYIDDMENKTAIECSRIWRERSLSWLKEHPTQYLAKIPGRLFYMYKNDIDNISAFIPDKSHAERNYTTLPLASLHKEIGKLSSIQYFALAATVCYLTLIILFLFGTILLINRKQWKALFIPFFIIVGGSFALVLAVHGETRFKYPYMPFIFMLAAYAINIIISYIYLSLKEKNVIV